MDNGVGYYSLRFVVNEAVTREVFLRHRINRNAFFVFGLRYTTS